MSMEDGEQILKHTIEVNIYEVICRAVNSGIEGGWNKAHKYTDTPEVELIKERIYDYIMLDLCEILKFEGE